MNVLMMMPSLVHTISSSKEVDKEEDLLSAAFIVTGGISRGESRLKL